MKRICPSFGRILIAAAVGFSFFFAAGCTDKKYSVHLHPMGEAKKIPKATIAVLPLNDLRYEIPTSCFPTSGASIESGKEKYQKEWNVKIASMLKEGFPNQKFVFIGAETPLDLFAIAEASKRAATAELVSVLNEDKPVYEPLTLDAKMVELLKPLVDSLNAQYAITFCSASLAGNTHTSFSAGPSGVGASSQTVYQADVQALVWECSTGQLLFSSGGWGSGSGFLCITPQSMAIESSDSKLKTTLLNLISAVIRYNEEKYCAVSRQ